jgi:Methyltransferase domain
MPVDYSTQLLTKFPVASQTSNIDKEILLALQRLLASVTGRYNYIEIGSFMGGSLAPFILDPKCKNAYSIDERERQQPDERGIMYDYGGVTSTTMLNELKKHGLRTDKVTVHDGSIESFRPGFQKFDMGFIDGEHTDEGCFRDFTWLLPVMKRNSIIAFHDNVLVYRALKLILIFLNARKIKHHIHTMMGGSCMSVIGFGKFAGGGLGEHLPVGVAIEDFYTSAEKEVMRFQILNRVTFKLVPNQPLEIELNQPVVQKAF